MAATPEDALSSRMGALFVQVNGPNTKPIYAGCVDVDDITESKGDVDLVRCFDPSGRGWKTVAQTLSPPDPVTTTLTGLMFKTANVIERLTCPAVVYALSICGEGNRRDVFNNYDRGLALNVARPTEITWSSVVMREEDGPSTRAVALSANPPVYEFFNLKSAVARQSTTQTQALNSVSICAEQRCAGECGVTAIGLGDNLIAGGDTKAGSPTDTAEVIYTSNGGTWAETAADPFASGEDVAAVTCVQLDSDTTRLIVARGTTDAGNPAEIAYSDDSGATWTNVDVGAVNGQFAPNNGSLFALNRNNIWLGTDDGYVYKSEDAGESWTAQESGVITTDEINGIVFADENKGFFVGNSNIVAKTYDSGNTWSAVTAPAAQAGIDVFSVEWSGRLWIGYQTTGEVWYSEDEGDNWTQRTYDGAASKVSIPAISFSDELNGFFVANTAGPVGTIYKTVDGGYNWQALTTPTNSGLNDIIAVDPNLAYAVGEVNGSTAVILKVNVYPDLT